MKINTQAKNIELTEAISEYLSKKLTMIEKYIDQNDTSALCDVEVGKTTNHHKQGDVFRAEINLTIAGAQFYAVSEKDNLYAAIDEVKDEVIRELTHSKTKHNSLLKRGGQKIKDMLRGL